MAIISQAPQILMSEVSTTLFFIQHHYLSCPLPVPPQLAIKSRYSYFSTISYMNVLSCNSTAHCINKTINVSHVGIFTSLLNWIFLPPEFLQNKSDPVTLLHKHHRISLEIELHPMREEINALIATSGNSDFRKSQTHSSDVSYISPPRERKLVIRLHWS